RKTLPYDPLKDFEFIATFAVTPNVLAVNAKLPVKTVKELIDYAKTRGSTFKMASAGIGSQSHMTGIAFMIAGGFESLHVPYKGGGPSVASVVAGETQWVLTPAGGVMGFVRSGQLRGLGQTLPQRSEELGDLPAIA